MLVDKWEDGQSVYHLETMNVNPVVVVTFYYSDDPLFRNPNSLKNVPLDQKPICSTAHYSENKLLLFLRRPVVPESGFFFPKHN